MSERFVMLPKLTPEQMQSLGGGALAVLYALCDARRNDNGLSVIGGRLLTVKAGLSHPRYTRKAVTALLSIGIISIEGGGRGKGNRSIYRVRLDSEMGTDGTHLDKPKMGTESPSKWVQKVHDNGYPLYPTNKTTNKTTTKTPSPKAPATEFTTYFVAVYERARGKKYIHAGGKDANAVKRILAAVGNDLSHAKAIADRYLADADNFVARNGHTLSLLSSRLNVYTPTTAAAGSDDIDAIIASDRPSPFLRRQPSAGAPA